MLSSADSPAVGQHSAARKRYARIPEVLPVPNLIELQLESFRWFIEKGLRELFDEISPIKDFTGKVMELQFLDYEFGDPKYSEEECRTKDLTFSRPLYVNVEVYRALYEGGSTDPRDAAGRTRRPAGVAFATLRPEALLHDALPPARAGGWRRSSSRAGTCWR